MDVLAMTSEIIKDFSLWSSNTSNVEIPLFNKIKEKMALGEELIFILPAFPAKSPSPEKTLGAMPDYGEVLALENLQELCDRFNKIYRPGAKVVICSDGRVFSDVVNVTDINIDNYNNGIKKIIKEFNFHSLSVFSMDDLFPTKSPDELRDLLLNVYAMTIEEVKALVVNDSHYRNLFNGIHKFLSEDEFSLNKTSSKSAIQKETKKRSYELMRRSDAWSNLLEVHFRDALRLSIHPHPINHEKFGIKLVPSSSKWATPWHNVVVKVKNKFELMHRREAEKLNAIIKMEKGDYAYFEVPAL